MGFFNIFDSYGRNKKGKESKEEAVDNRPIGITVESLFMNPSKWMTFSDDLISGKAVVRDTPLTRVIFNNEMYMYVMIEKSVKIWKDFIETHNLGAFENITIPWLEEEPLYILRREAITRVDYNHNKQDVFLPSYYTDGMNFESLQEDFSVDLEYFKNKFGIDPETNPIRGYRKDENGEHIWLDHEIGHGILNGKSVSFAIKGGSNFYEDCDHNLTCGRDSVMDYIPEVCFLGDINKLKDAADKHNFFEDIQLCYNIASYVYTGEKTYELFQTKTDCRTHDERELEFFENDCHTDYTPEHPEVLDKLAKEKEAKITSPEFVAFLNGLRDKYLDRVTTLLEERRCKAEKEYVSLRQDEARAHMSEAMETLADAYADAYESGIISLSDLESMCSQYGINSEYVLNKTTYEYDKKYVAGDYIVSKKKQKGEDFTYGQTDNVFSREFINELKTEKDETDKSIE